VRVSYEAEELTKPGLVEILSEFTHRHKPSLTEVLSQ
jgi:hypothetical protein